MRISIHAGHNPKGKIACGAVGFLDESEQARKVVKYVKKYLKKVGYKVYDDTCNNGTSVEDVLHKILNKINKHKNDLVVSIHFNSGANDSRGNKRTTGTEIWVKTINNLMEDFTTPILTEISKLGFKNRGVKRTENLFILNEVLDTPVMLIECCFVDDIDDYNIYNAKKMGSAIATGIINACLMYEDITVKTLINGVYQRTQPINRLKPVSKLKKGTELLVRKVKITNGVMWAYTHRGKWIRLKNTKAVD